MLADVILYSLRTKTIRIIYVNPCSGLVGHQLARKCSVFMDPLYSTWCLYESTFLPHLVPVRSSLHRYDLFEEDQPEYYPARFEGLTAVLLKTKAVQNMCTVFPHAAKDFSSFIFRPE
jgi:hypothetical protein